MPRSRIEAVEASDYICDMHLLIRVGHELD